MSIVISPRIEGLKPLACRLTKVGTDTVEDFIEEFRENYPGGTYEQQREYVLEAINVLHRKFYYQVPFRLSDDPCFVVDFRQKEQVINQLQDLVVSTKMDFVWMSTDKKAPTNRK